MNHTTIFLLFGIPAACIALIGLNQLKDEMFKKKFEIERRKRPANEPRPPEHSRRYTDLKTPTEQANSIQRR